MLGVALSRGRGQAVRARLMLRRPALMGWPSRLNCSAWRRWDSC